LPTVIVYAVVDDSLSPISPRGDAVDTFIRREDAERFIEEVRTERTEARELPADRGAGSSLAERARSRIGVGAKACFAS
jgi:hypothetical protein